MGKVYFQDQTGHTTVEFDKADPASLKIVNDKIAEAIQQGARLAVKTGDGQFEIAKALDPNVDESLVIPQLIGG